MSSLAGLQTELVGFFSYSRQDDLDSDGTLSALRERIQRELRGQLGRSPSNFHLWQDKQAIAPGTLWESEIETGIGQSVFFIPIVTPTAVGSPQCEHEFESFLAREAALERNDLTFPILYIRVPELENERQWRNHPVLRIIGTRQYVDWRSLRHLDVNSTEVRIEIERFCEQIVKALRKPWVPPEERKRREEEAARRRAEEERREREAEEQRRAEEARKTQEEARQHAEEARRREQAAAQQRAEEERRARDAQADQLPDDLKELTVRRTDRQDPKTTAPVPVGSNGAPDKRKPSMSLIRTLRGHTQWIKSAAIAPSGATLASGCGVIISDPELWLWDIGEGAILTKLSGHTNDISRLAFSKDATILASSSLDKTFRLWSLPEGKPLHVLKMASGVTSFDFSPDGRLLAAGCLDKMIRIWRCADWQLLRTLEQHENSVSDVAFSRDGSLLASASAHGIWIWKIADWRSWPVDDSKGDGLRLALSPDGTLLAAGSKDRPIRIWRVSDFMLHQTLQRPKGFLSRDIAFSPNGLWLGEASLDGSIALWRIADGQLLCTIKEHTDFVNSIAFSADSAVLVSASDDKTIQLRSLQANFAQP